MLVLIVPMEMRRRFAAVLLARMVSQLLTCRVGECLAPIDKVTGQSTGSYFPILDHTTSPAHLGSTSFADGIFAHEKPCVVLVANHGQRCKGGRVRTGSRADQSRESREYMYIWTLVPSRTGIFSIIIITIITIITIIAISPLSHTIKPCTSTNSHQPQHSSHVKYNPIQRHLNFKMHFTTVLSLLAGTSTALAMPRAESVAARFTPATPTPDWVVQDFTRTCNAADTSCEVKLTINSQGSRPSTCRYSIKGNPASRADRTNVDCGIYKVSSGWSGQFGPKNGFTTWAIVDEAKRLRIWPAYADSELVDGRKVTPDKSYAPQAY